MLHVRATTVILAPALGEPTASAAAQLAPLRRVNFCQGLWLGAAWGFAAGTVGAMVSLHGHRRGFTKRVNIASGP
ncbi:MAG TPA: hypothetical protein VK137_13250, partial [Planctomycetaceae bacterium]|nr:hypothetical protein [Planctomycetaceae bacterium]